MSFFAYFDNIPFATNNPSADQPNMLTNTNSIDNLIAGDHHSFNDNLGGYHKVIHQDPVVADPAAIPGIGQTYVKTVSGDQQLFYQTGNGVINQISQPFTTGTGTQVVTNVASTVMTLPTNCIGFIVLHSSTIGPQFSANAYSFFSKAGNLYIQAGANYQNLIINAKSGAPVNPLDFQVFLVTGTGPLNAEFKFIYWSV